MPSPEKKTTAEEFVKNASPDCLSCENFGDEKICPAFKLAAANGMDKEKAKMLIQNKQRGIDLNACDKA